MYGTYALNTALIGYNLKYNGANLTVMAFNAGKTRDTNQVYTSWGGITTGYSNGFYGLIDCACADCTNFDLTLFINGVGNR
jgi:hypothetical protein